MDSGNDATGDMVFDLHLQKNPGPQQDQMRIRPWQSTKVVGCSNGPRSGVGNLDMSLLSLGAGDRGVPGGIW